MLLLLSVSNQLNFFPVLKVGLASIIGYYHIFILCMVKREKTLFLTFEASDESVLPKEQKKVDVGKRVKLLSIWEHVGGVKRGC